MSAMASVYGQPGSAIPPSASSGRSSPDSFDVEDDMQGHLPGQWPSSTEHASPDGQDSTQQLRSAAPMQKRRRVTRACDECRRKKIKCDGKQPCTHCTVYSYDCTYDQPSNRRRNPAPQYIEALEIRLRRAEALLRTFNPSIDLNDPNLDSLIQQRQGASSLDVLKAQVAQQKPKLEPGASQDEDAQLQAMIESTGSLDIDDRGHWDFHGGSSGAVFLKRMRDQLGTLLAVDTNDHVAPFLPRAPRAVVTAFDSPRSIHESPNEPGLPNTLDLPPKEFARILCVNALSRACTLLRFVHQPTFYHMFDRIFDLAPEEFGDEEYRYLPLLYQILALGSIFSDDSVSFQGSGEIEYKASMDQGLKYFRASKAIMDITDCRDIVSLQSILFMILFLQSTSYLSTCYSYIGIALRSALRMGLHRNISSNFNPIERETRRRVFWIIRKMDTYVSALLGFPRMLADEDIDQEMPIEIDDEYITKDAILPMPEGKTSLYAACNAHTRLMQVLAKVISYIYPIKGIEQSAKVEKGATYAISHAKIKEIEGDLQQWLDKLPMGLRPGGEADEEMSRCQQLLRMAYAHVQMMLYRPFLHHVSQRVNSGKNVDERAYACAAACVSVSRNIVHICAELKKRGLLVGAYWFTMYTTFFAILSLVFFVLENPDKQGTREILADALAGKETLKSLARRSMAADRCSTALEGLFDKLPEDLKRRNSEPITQKKKRAAHTSQEHSAQKAHEAPDHATIRQPVIKPLSKDQRATTFPMSLNTAPNATTSFDSPTYRSVTLPEQNLNYRRSYHDLVSPASGSSVGTPNSVVSGSSIPPPFFPQPNFMGNTNIPDFGAMMFPSTDPFAYPNQPFMDFEQRQGEQNMGQSNYMSNESRNTSPNMFTGNEGGTVSYDNLEGQLFGPLPPYLMQAQGGTDVSGIDMNTMGGMMVPTDSMSNNIYGPSQGAGGVLGSGMNFDDIFASNNDDWNAMMAEPGYRQ